MYTVGYLAPILVSVGYYPAAKELRRGHASSFETSEGRDIRGAALPLEIPLGLFADATPHGREHEDEGPVLCDGVVDFLLAGWDVRIVVCILLLLFREEWVYGEVCLPVELVHGHRSDDYAFFFFFFSKRKNCERV